MSVQYVPSEYLHITFGDRVRRLRIAAGMNQIEFGDAIDYSGAAVGRWETADDTPRSARRIITAVQLRFGKAAADFLRGVEDSPDPAAITASPQSTDYRTLAVAA